MRTGGQRYRKRRPLPAFLLILVLGIAATVVWIRVMTADNEATGAAHCDPPAATSPTTALPGAPPPAPAPTLGKPLEPTALDRVAPISPSTTPVRVMNASAQRGQARLVTESLRALGFTQIADPANDGVYGESMTCRAQIRFGELGAGAARTISLVEPCAELIRDERQDNTVDFAVGEKFDDLKPNRAARTLLEQMNDLAKQAPPTQGGLQADETELKLDATLLTAARNVKC